MPPGHTRRPAGWGPPSAGADQRPGPRASRPPDGPANQHRALPPDHVLTCGHAAPAGSPEGAAGSARSMPRRTSPPAISNRCRVQQSRRARARRRGRPVLRSRVLRHVTRRRGASHVDRRRHHQPRRQLCTDAGRPMTVGHDRRPRARSVRDDSSPWRAQCRTRRGPGVAHRRALRPVGGRHVAMGGGGPPRRQGATARGGATTIDADTHGRPGRSASSDGCTVPGRWRRQVLDCSCLQRRRPDSPTSAVRGTLFHVEHRSPMDSGRTACRRHVPAHAPVSSTPRR